METTVGDWGNSLAVRIPNAFAQTMGIKSGMSIRMVMETPGRLVLERVLREPVYTMEELLEGMTPENRHPLMDWGDDVGKERWWEE